MQESKIYTNNNCIGCNLCISNCPCTEANVAKLEHGQNKIYIDPDRCIVCGECVRKCPHNAREYLDDTERFFDDLQQGREISIITAPSLRTNFDRWENLLGYLRSSGVRHLLDSSFGADISTWAYIRYMQDNEISGLVSQPCPAVVNYLERYLPELLPQLAPVQSPVMCTAIYMRKYRNITGSFALLSPCIAKRDEVMDSNNGRLIEYSLTFRKLEQYLRDHHIDYTSSRADGFDNEQHGLGAVFPMPGGLKVNVEQYLGDVWIHQIEGQPEVSVFLHHYSQLPQDQERPFLVDILSCPHGCNVGTGSVRRDEDSLEISRQLYHVRRQMKELPRRKIPGPNYKRFDRELHLDDFRRAYSNKVKRNKVISQEERDDAFSRMGKFNDLQRRIDCRSCGFASCSDMAEAVAKGLNHPENCVEYIKYKLDEHTREVANLAQERALQAAELRENVESIFSAISQSTQRTEQTLTEIKNIHDRIQLMSDISSRLENNVVQLRDEIDKYVEMGDEVVRLSKQTSLLSLNASVEAIRAGNHGRGFTVVVEQINSLSDQTEQSAKEALENNEVITPLLEEVDAVSHEVLRESSLIASNADNILQAVEALTQIQQNIHSFASQLARGD